MPPKGRGAQGARGAPPQRGAGPAIRATPSTQTSAAPSASAHITTVGVKRTAYGTSGVQRLVQTNHFPITIPKATIVHYDVVITPSEKVLPARLNFDLITHLQTAVAPDIFTPRAVYDGRKNLFAATTLAFPNGQDSSEFEVSLSDTRTADASNSDAKGPKQYKVRLTKVAQINPVVLERFLEGKQSHDNDVLTAITALNVVIRMEPSLRYPFNVRSFFTSREKKDIGCGIELWRGFFQSARPAIGRMLINIDISTGAMYKAGPLLDLCLDYVGKKGQPLALAPKRGFPERERLRLQRFISGIRVITTHADRNGNTSKTPRVVRKISQASAADMHFTKREGGSLGVAQYFEGIMGKPLKYPDLPCVEVGSGALIPLELCIVPEGQIMRKQVPAQLTKSVLEFATRRPDDRLKSIQNGLSVLSYGQSEYVRQFGMHMPDPTPLKVQARLLPPPTLRYGAKSRTPTITPRDGAWNMRDKQFYEPKAVTGWVVIVYERQERFTPNSAYDLVKGLLEGFEDVGMPCAEKKPSIKWYGGQGRIVDQLREVYQEYGKKTNSRPSLFVVVLPEGATDIYTSIKYFGDCMVGMATQCLKSNKCYRAKKQYYANVCLKINVKLGGINSIPDPSSVRYLTDDANPTLVMGADVIHPAPGSEGRPSFTAVVGNVDSTAAYYVASSPCIQTSRQEMIDDLERMATHIISMYRDYRKRKERKSNVDPKRIIFYRDGVSEGQFQQVIDIEVPKLRAACSGLGINPPPKITVIVVGKRHHVRFFPMSPRDADASGNCPAGTVVDRDVTNPAEFDFYLQSHGGLLGTSRPSHYNVLLDENGFTPDGLQQLSFALCHVYARSTRSVSIPAPVYYADIVCARAKNHFDPLAEGFSFSDTATTTDDRTASTTLEQYQKNYKALAEKSEFRMFFS